MAEKSITLEKHPLEERPARLPSRGPSTNRRPDYTTFHIITSITL